MHQLPDGSIAYAQPDWERLKVVVSNHGPASQRRLELRRQFWRRHSTVRELLN